mmetsp:Transcript_6409/g.27247  ORF Transcript_6409/g.27247 Transcript_6409/m.27247 type:complete len:212 (+) Transcript_6409:1047-1682(+)
MLVSTTTQAPPRNSPPGGMYTKTGCLYSLKASTISEPNLSTSSNISLIPPENPRQLATMNNGRPSRFISRIAWAVLCEESGNQTWPACCSTRSCVSGEAGSAGVVFSTVRASTAMMPKGIPPSRARPVTTVFAHPETVSIHDPLSKIPVSAPFPQINSRGSYGTPLAGEYVTPRPIGSSGSTIGRRPFLLEGIKLNQSKIERTPSTSSFTT